MTVVVVAGVLALSPAGSVASAATGSSPTSASGTDAPPYPATGYFSVAQKGSGWTLVTPQGQPFYASGIDTVSPDGSGTDQVTGLCPYCETVANDFPNDAAWATSTVAQLRSWGFNSIGGFSDNADLGSQMPYEVQLSMASGNDWFAPSFVTNADQVAAADVAPLANDPNVIGYFTDTELDWGPLLGDGFGNIETALQQYLQLPAGSPGLAVAQQYVGNPSGFLTALATRYFSVTSAAIHTYDTNHLILGAKAEGQEIEPNLIKAAAPYVNVFSIEDYVLAPGLDQIVDNIWPAYLPVQQNLADLESVANIPLMIGEYSFTSTVNSSGDPDTQNVYQRANSQQQRASEFENFIAPLYEDTPALVGDDWFQYVDEPPGGRTGDGENSDFGMIDVNGNPYPTMVARHATHAWGHCRPDRGQRAGLRLVGHGQLRADLYRHYAVRDDVSLDDRDHLIADGYRRNHLPNHPSLPRTRGLCRWRNARLFVRHHTGFAPRWSEARPRERLHLGDADDIRNLVLHRAGHRFCWIPRVTGSLRHRRTGCEALCHDHLTADCPSEQVLLRHVGRDRRHPAVQLDRQRRDIAGRSHAQFGGGDQRDAHRLGHLFLLCRGHRLDQSHRNGNGAAHTEHPSSDKRPAALDRRGPSEERARSTPAHPARTELRSVQFEISGGSFNGHVIGTGTGIPLRLSVEFRHDRGSERELLPPERGNRQ